MIGQKELRQRISDMVSENVFPQFAMIVGEEGSGKKTLVKEIEKLWPEKYWLQDVSVDTIRKMITQAYKCTGKMLYIIPDAHRMSPQAKNALLKIVEEPPKFATFIMTVSYEQTILGTLKSRGTIFQMNRYSRAELQEYLMHSKSAQNERYILSVANTMSDIDKLLKIEITALQKHINTVLDKANTLTLANLLKSATLIDFKGEDGYDVSIFFKAVREEIYERAKSKDRPENILMLYRMLEVTERSLSDIQNPAINKRYTYESWLFSIREIKNGHWNS